MTEAASRNRFVIEPGELVEGPQAMAIPLDGGATEVLVEHQPPSGKPIEPGRALAIADFDPPETTLSERIVRLAYRLGVSGHTLTAPFRKPVRPRLLATVESPLAGDRVAGMALRAGHFLVLGVKTPIAQVDFSPAAKLPPPFERVVHGFTWLRDARQWGYQRVAAGKTVLQFDAAPPPLTRHARHGCASTLAFELSHGEHRLIVNCGGAALAGGQVPVRIEQGLRATAAHSTLVLGDANSTAVLINGKLGQGVGEVEVDRRMLTSESGAAATRLEASHDGYASRFGLVHRRILILREDGTELRGEDLLVPAGRKGRGKVPYALRFHLGPGVEIALSGGGRGATLALPDGGYWQFVAGDNDLEIDESLWVDGEGRPHPVQQLVMQGLASRGGASFSWLLKKIR